MRRPNDRGYTILELMVTVGLAAVLLSLGAGAFLGGGGATGYRQVLADTAGG